MSGEGRARRSTKGPRMADLRAEECSTSRGNRTGPDPLTTTVLSKIAYTVIFLLIAGSLVLFFIGIFNFSYPFGPALLGIGVLLFVLTLLFSGFFWACVREKRQGHLPWSFRGQAEGVPEEGAISVINQHFNMGMPGIDPEPPLDHWGNPPPDRCYDPPKNTQHGQRHSLDSALRSGNTAQSASYDEPPPSYWEAIRTKDSEN